MEINYGLIIVRCPFLSLYILQMLCFRLSSQLLCLFIHPFHFQGLEMTWNQIKFKNKMRKDWKRKSNGNSIGFCSLLSIKLFRFEGTKKHNNNVRILKSSCINTFTELKEHKKGKKVENWYADMFDVYIYKINVRNFSYSKCQKP